MGAAVAVRFVFLACVAGWWRVRGSGAGYVCFSGARRGRAVFVPCSGAAFFFLGRASRAVLGRCLGACFFPCVRLGRAFSSDYGARWASPASKTTGDRSPCASRIKFIFEIFFSRAPARTMNFFLARMCAHVSFFSCAVGALEARPSPAPARFPLSPGATPAGPDFSETSGIFEVSLKPLKPLQELGDLKKRALQALQALGELKNSVFLSSPSSWRGFRGFRETIIF